MNAVIVNCFDTYENRVDLVSTYLKKKDIAVTVIQSDFRHFKKTYRDDRKENYLFVKSKKYTKNLSIARLQSHYLFAKEAFKLVDKIKPDLLYVLLPPNSLAEFSTKYKNKNKNVKLIFDLIDLWPETMPIKSFKNVPPLNIWRLKRDKNLPKADFVITECDLYQNVLGNILNKIDTKTIYLSKEKIEVKKNIELSSKEINLAYLGSINNIIDIPGIIKVIKMFQRIKPVILHIIGDGESREEFIKSVEEEGVLVKYYGNIYSSQRKQDIFDKCHFGLNIMKSTVCVGLTMKSIDYFQHGLPIINNIPGDTEKFIRTFRVGYNVEEFESNNMSSMRNVLNGNMEGMRERTSNLFEENFSVKSFEENFSFVINKLLN